MFAGTSIRNYKEENFSDKKWVKFCDKVQMEDTNEIKTMLLPTEGLSHTNFVCINSCFCIKSIREETNQDSLIKYLFKKAS